MEGPILIIGAGPAGLSAAIFLRQLGMEVCVVDRKKKSQQTGPIIGESLPPDAKLLLEQLDVWDEFEQGPHLKCYGNKSYWFSDQPQYHDFMQHPVGHGWHIDRVEFEALLLRKAQAVGAHLLEETAVNSAVYGEELWRITLVTTSGAATTLVTPFVVDATGRNSWIARRQGVDRLYEDQQLALVSFLRNKKPFDDTTTLVETTSKGWWYTAKIPGERIATAFFCKPSGEQRQQWVQSREWQNLLQEAPQTNERLIQTDFDFITEPRFVSAESGILDQLYGDHWLAIGDAALTYDPIASHGLMMAMVSARDAARVIHQFLSGDEEALVRYNALLQVAFREYARQRTSFFA